MTGFSRSGGAKPRAASAFNVSSHRLVEALEARVLLSTFFELLVTNTNDSGPGSLRQAILNANDPPGTLPITGVIVFNIPGPGVHTIVPLSPLPTITHTTTVDGTSQPGYSASVGAPVIEIDGAEAGGGTNGLVLGTTGSGADGSMVKGLIINHFSQDGVLLQGQNDQIKGCYIGVDALGDAAAPNGGFGITINGGQALVGGSTTADRNVISGNRLAGIDDLTNNAAITGNYIGTDAIGSAAIGNGHEGVRVLGGDIALGGAGPLRNVISGNGYSGVYVESPGGAAIAGNYIGTNAAGTAAVGNGTSPTAPYRDGITSVVPLVVGSPASGSTPAVVNVISGNRGAGISITSAPIINQTQIQSNFIGTDASGNVSLGNAGGGIIAAGGIIGGASGVLAAGTSIVAAGGNLISGNAGDGILILGRGTIQGNYIGTNLAGTAAIPNSGNGIEIQASNVTVGTTLSPPNVISGNGANGILIDNAAQRGTSIGQEHIIANLIGTDASGTVALGNAGDGILSLGTFQDVIESGDSPQRPQVISGNGGAGISLVGQSNGINAPFGGVTGIGGNLIGTNLAGNAPLGNAGNGIEIFESADMIDRNVVSANGSSGVYLGEVPFASASTQGSSLFSNRIGTSLSGTVVPGLGNAGDGITIFRSSNNTVGNDSTSGLNTIASNGGNGITVTSGGLIVSDQFAEAVHNRIGVNSTFSNGGLGIDLGDDGVTPNGRQQELANGPNFLEGFPVIFSAVSGPTSTVVRFQLVNQATTVNFYSNSTADPSGYGEGQTFVKSTTGGATGTTLTATLPPLPVGTILSATATDSAGDTSEFSFDVATIAPPPTVTHSAFNPQNNTVVFTFSKDVSASLSPEVVRVHNQTSGADVAVSGVSYDSSTNTATFQLPSALPSGTYLVTLLARGVTDSSGEHLDGNADGTPGDDYLFQFTVVSGDVNLDGAVSFDDLLILARNYGQAGTFSQGDLNHDGTVDFADLLILAQGYRQGAASPA